MTFRLEHDRTLPAPSLTWVRARELLEQMALEGERGRVPLSELEQGLARARAALAAPVRNAREQRARAALRIIVDLFDRARRDAARQGAEAFEWREDF